jgi:hypothetical protein
MVAEETVGNRSGYLMLLSQIGDYLRQQFFSDQTSQKNSL